MSTNVTTNHDLKSVILPWHEAFMTRLCDLKQANTFPHAIMLQASKWAGVEPFAFELAKTLLCEHTRACGVCRSCHWVELRTHSDFLVLGEEKNIAIAEIRELIAWAGLSAEHKRKVVVLNAQKLNLAASHALLKVLEEPPNAVHFILHCEDSHRVLPTIRSRVVFMMLPKPSRENVLQWLSDNHIAFQETFELCEEPLRALEPSGNQKKILDDLIALSKHTVSVVEIAECWHDSPREALYLVQRILNNRMSSFTGVECIDHLSLQTFEWSSYFQLQQAWLKASQALLNPGMKASYVFQSFLIEWKKCFQGD